MPSVPTHDDIDYAGLVHEDRVHGALYTDPLVYEQELQRIWYSTWVFVGHESEVPEPNDYVRKSIGPQDIIMARGEDGQVRLLLNRCAHRANLVCEFARGNSSSFRCPYHGWTFRNTGQLLGYPFKQGYGDLKADGVSLASVPRVDSYAGFLFGSFAVDGPSLLEHLGAARSEIDRLVRLAPEGELSLGLGWTKHRAHANWKLLFENETDGYHPLFVHGAIMAAAESHMKDLYTDKSEVIRRYLGNGHVQNDLRPEFRRHGQPMLWLGTTTERVPQYVANLRQAHGERADTLLIEGAPHVMIFPNLFIGEIHVTVFQPLAPDLTIQHDTAVQFKGGAELNRRVLQQTVGSVGPAGMFLADDTEMHDRNQRGLRALLPEWVDVSRGLQREHADESGFKVGRATDETGMRGFWSHYLTLMSQPPSAGSS
jgi:fatty-acyl-CoA synthase